MSGVRRDVQRSAAVALRRSTNRQTFAMAYGLPPMVYGRELKGIDVEILSLIKEVTLGSVGLATGALGLWGCVHIGLVGIGLVGTQIAQLLN